MPSQSEAAITLAALTPIKRRVGWRQETRNGKPTKIPYDPRTGTKAEADDPNTWATHDEAARWAESQHGNGAGIMLGAFGASSDACVCGIDLDSCRDPNTGQIVAWAQPVIDRFATCTEISPSRTGVKLFFALAAADLPAAEALFDGKFGRQFKRADDGHPPAIEIYRGRRYFAVTWETCGDTENLRIVSLADIEWLIRDYGPQFVGTDGGGAGSGGKDKSRSGRAFGIGAALKMEGASYEDMKTALLGHKDPEIAEWARTKGMDNGERELRRIYDRADGGGGGGRERAKRPQIQVRVGEMQRAVNEAETALIAAQPAWPAAMKVFRRGDRVAAIAIDRTPDHKGRMVEGQIIVEVGEHALAERLGVAAQFVKWDNRMAGGGGLKRVDPPKDMVKTLVERGYALKLPILVGVVNCPQFMFDGRILDKPGYDAATGMFCDPRGAQFLAVADRPIRVDALACGNRLLVLFHTFDFKTDTDRAVAMSLVLTRLARLAMATAPLHAFDAPTAGSGKSMIVDIAAILATGETAPVMAQGATLEEFEKRYSVQLMAGRQIIAIDNVNADLDGDLLNQSLTQQSVDLRILGQSRKVTVRTSTVTTATGNNLKVIGDLTRRSLIARLDPGTDRPEIRQFDYDPLEDARENRGELVAAALTILRAYHVAGRPGQPARLQGFTEWSDLVRGALMWIGLGDPADTQETLRMNDPVLTKLIRVATVWRETFKDMPMTVAEVVEKAEAKKTVGTIVDYRTSLMNPGLFDACMAAIRRSGTTINPDMLGNYLSQNVDRIVALETGEKVRFQKARKLQGAVLWELFVVEHHPVP